MVVQTEAMIGNWTPENDVGKMLRNEAGWSTVVTFIEMVLRFKREEGLLDD